MGGNPFAEAALEHRLSAAPPVVDSSEVSFGEKLGSGAGATVYKGRWRDRDVAVKVWEAEQFSDGTARGEWAVNRVASSPGHRALVGVLASFERPQPGMVLELLEGASAAAGPPTTATVTRDALPSHGGRGPLLSALGARMVAEAVAQATAYLHGRGLTHGDIYLHNTLVVTEQPLDGGGSSACTVRDARLSDFGAAAAVPDDDDGRLLQRLETRSFGWLLQDLLDLLAEAAPTDDTPPAREADREAVCLLRLLRERCAHHEVDKLPSFAELAAALGEGGVGQKRMRDGTPLGAL